MAFNAFTAKGLWDATVNRPFLVPGRGENGDAWLVSVAGETALGQEGRWLVGDIAFYAIDRWVRLNSSNLELYREVTAAGAIVGNILDTVVGVNKTIGEPTTVSLPPNPRVGKRFSVLDAKGDAETNRITINGPINGGTFYQIKTNFGAVHLLAISATAWRILG